MNTPKGKNNMHSIRINDDLWEAFIAKAQSEGTTGAAIIRGVVQEYMDGKYYPPIPCSPEILHRFQLQVSKNELDLQEAIEALLNLYISGKVDFQTTIKAVAK